MDTARWFSGVWLLLLLLLLLFGVVTSQSSYNASYEWRPGPWSGCSYRDSRECCDCYRKRDVHCVLRDGGSGDDSGGGGQRIAPFYCRKLSEPQPPERERCERCQQDCVFSVWGEWSACSETCTPATRFRTRNVLLLPSSGGNECGSLLDIENCVTLHHCDIIDPAPKFDWFTGDWTSCRKVCDVSALTAAICSRS